MIMKRTPLLISTFSLICALRAQDDGGTVTLGNDTALKSLMRLEFQVPDNPAFKALGIDPSEILRPTSIKDLALTVAPYVNGEGISLPKNFALEYSPGRIASERWSQTEYRSNGLKRLWANTAFSLATRFNEDEGALNPYQTGVGVRFEWLSERADPVRNKVLSARFGQEQLAEYTSEQELIRYYAELRFLQSADVAVPERMRRITQPQDGSEQKDSTAYVEWRNAVADSLGAGSLSAGTKARLMKIGVDLSIPVHGFKGRLKQFQDTTWNAFRFDLACAWLGQARDTTLRELSSNSLHGWAVLATPLGKDGQVLFGGAYSLDADPDSAQTEQEISLNLRGYYGRDRIRGFAEVQYKSTTLKVDKDATTAALLFNMGIEAKLSDRLGVLASTGIENYLDAKPDVLAVLKSNLDLRYYFQ